MSESTKFLLLGIVLTLLAFALLMPFYRGRTGAAYMPYYAHGGREYRPGVLY